MATRKPLVIDANNRTSELPAGDRISGYAASLAFYLTDGTYQPIPLTSTYELPFYLSNGTLINIPMVLS